MLCQRCNKNQAVVKLVHKVGGKPTEMFLCKNCSTVVYDTPLQNPFAYAFDNIFQSQALAAFVDIIGGLSTTQTATTKIQCKECRMSVDEFRKTLFVGCPNCYNVFAESMVPILKSVQDSTMHKFAPNLSNNNANTQREILLRELEKARSEERYEDAAELRDRIKKLREDIDI